MTGVYDEMSERSYPNYPGGTPEQREHRQVLRAAMEAQGFTVYRNGVVALRLSRLAALRDPEHSVRGDPVASLARLRALAFLVGHASACQASGARPWPASTATDNAQYVLVGIAQIIFYLLLLSLAESSRLDAGFLIAGGATVTLLAANAGWVFVSRLQAARALGVFTLLYALIYTLLRLEDNALLIGAIASFAAVAAVMYFTRNVDWYGRLPGSASSIPQPATPTPNATAKDWSLGE